MKKYVLFTTLFLMFAFTARSASAQATPSPMQSSSDYLNRQMMYDSMTWNRMMTERGGRRAHSVRKKHSARKPTRRHRRHQSRRRVSLNISKPIADYALILPTNDLIV